MKKKNEFFDGLKLKGKIVLQLFGSNGLLKDKREIENLIVTAGKTKVLNVISGLSSDSFNYVAVGSGAVAPALGDTDLGSILGSRKIDATPVVAGLDLTLGVTFGAGESTGAITEAGVFTAVTLGTMLCRQTFAVINKAAGDSLAVTWTISIT